MVSKTVTLVALSPVARAAAVADAAPAESEVAPPSTWQARIDFLMLLTFYRRCLMKTRNYLVRNRRNVVVSASRRRRRL